MGSGKLCMPATHAAVHSYSTEVAHSLCTHDLWARCSQGKALPPFIPNRPITFSPFNPTRPHL